MLPAEIEIKDPQPALRPLPIRLFRNWLATRFVKTTPLEGIAQVQLLIAEGCTPADYVLEIGCGALIAGFPLIDFLDAGRYAGIDPNQWLVRASCRIPEVADLVARKRALFLDNSEFDAAAAGREFDFVLSHSILSHAAYWQLPQFLYNAGRCLKRGGKIIASLRFTEPNVWGSRGYHGTELDFKRWRYPNVTYFRKERVIKAAEEAGYHALHVPRYTETVTAANRSAFHDWVVFEKQ